MHKQNLIKLFSISMLALGLPLFIQAQCADHQALLDKLDQSMKSKDTDLLKEVYHSDAIRHTQEGALEGIDAIIESSKSFYTEVPDATGKNVDLICSGDKIVARWVGTGTPVQSNGKQVTVTGITIYEVKDGKIKTEWEEMNSIALMMQLGYALTPPKGGN